MLPERAKEVGTFERVTVAAACRSLAPDSPAPEIEQERFECYTKG